MAYTFQESVTLEKLSCGKCGGVFALNETFLNHARQNIGEYHCPYCKTSWGWYKSDAQKLREQLEATETLLRKTKCEVLNARQECDCLRADKTKIEKKLARVHKGVCPCCKRSFQNLQRHMATKHADVKVA